MVTLRQLFFGIRYPGTVVCVHCAVIRYDLYLSVTRFLATTTIVTAYTRDHYP